MVGIKYNVAVGVILGSIYPRSPGLLIWFTGILLPLSTMSTLWVLSVLTCTPVLLSTMSTPGSCMTDYTVVHITHDTGPTNPRVIVTI